MIETPKDRPDEAVTWRVFSVDPVSKKRSFIPAIGEPGVFWEWGWLGSRFVEGSKNSTRSLEVPLTAGRYKVLFESDTLSRLTDLVVPPGDGPLELPEIHLETVAWVKMMGKAAAEIEAVDIEGRLAKLADYRGKAIVLLFWSSKLDWMLKAIPDLTRIQKRFTQRSLAILAVHDASLTSLADFRTTLEPLRRSIDGEIPINFLLDRAPVGKGTGPVPTQAGEIGSGRSFDRYETSPSLAYIIDNSGRLVLAIGRPYGLAAITYYSIGSDGELVRKIEDCYDADGVLERKLTMHAIEGTLEDLFGIPRSPKPTVAKPRVPSKPGLTKWLEPKLPLLVKGRVVDPDGRPVAGADVFQLLYDQKKVKTNSSGEFVYTLEEAKRWVSLSIERDGPAPRQFELSFPTAGQSPEKESEPGSIELDGQIPQPLRMSRGSSIIGRLVRNGKPVMGGTVGLKIAGENDFLFPRKLEIRTADRGVFRLDHVPPETDFWVYGKLGSLTDNGAVVPVSLHSPEDNATVDLGDLRAEEGRTLAGRVVCSDGRTPWQRVHMLLGVPNAVGVLEAKLDEIGRFEFRAIPDGPVRVNTFVKNDKADQVYRLSTKNKCLEPFFRHALEGRLDRNIDDLTILLEPGKTIDRDPNSDIDPAVRADFNDAKAGPITGVPPGDCPPK